MKKNKKRIGVLTSGGDCAGLNAAICAIVHSGTHAGHDVIGIEDGTAGLLDRPIRSRILTPSDCRGSVMRHGGTVLGTTNKGNPFHFPMEDGSFKNRTQDIVDAVKEIKLDCVIGIGGDGSLAILRRLAQKGQFNFIGIPKTIDNDVVKTERSIGFDTAVHIATEALDRLQPTAASHDRVMILEVMGRDAGHIALTAGIAGYADVILIPEIEYDIKKVAQKIINVREDGRNFSLVIVSEAVKTIDNELLEVEHHGGEKRYGGIGHYLGERLADMTGSETRVTVLGHVQRGAAPTALDRVVASAFGVKAIELVGLEKYDRMVTWSERNVIDIPLKSVIAKCQKVKMDDTLVTTARELGICLGDI